MSAFAMFSLKDPSLLAFDERRRQCDPNLHTIYGIGAVPCDSQMRSILDPMEPDGLRPAFRAVFQQAQRGKFVSACYRKFAHHFTCRHEKKPQRVGGLDGVYSLKRLRDVP